MNDFAGSLDKILANLLRDATNKDWARWLDFTQDDREEFAQGMVAYGLPRFAKYVFEEGRLLPARRASLKTLFVNTCVVQFPSLYRKWSQDKSRIRPVDLEIGMSGNDRARDPAIEVAVRDEVTNIFGKIPDRQIQKALALRSASYTAADAARHADLALTAAERRTNRIAGGLDETAGSKELLETSSRRIDLQINFQPVLRARW